MPCPTSTQDGVTRAAGSLEVRLLGCVDFDSAMSLQDRLVFELSNRDDTQGGLLICEHPPLITVGREGSREHILAGQQELISRELDVRWLNRGGGCLVHAPGQLAVYPVVPLDRLGIGLSEYRRILGECVIAMCREMRMAAWQIDDRAEVCCRLGQFAWIGVAVKSWVAYHGLFINVSPAPELSRLVRPSDIGERVTSMASQRARITPMHVVRESLVRHLASRLGYQRYHVYTGHPLLHRTRAKVLVPSEQFTRNA